MNMKNIRLTYIVLLIGLTLLWLLADDLLAAQYEFFKLRASMVNYTGILAMGVMSVGILLSIRPISLEPFFGGLDKTYRLHKWLGITALVVSVVHWLWVKVPKWMVGWGLLVKPARKAAAEPSLALFRFFREQRGLAEQVGEWAFYIAVVLIVLALIKRFPYRHFFKTHRILAIVYLALVFHSVVLMKTDYWSSPIGVVMAVLMAVGSAAAFVSLFRKVGHKRRAVGVIDELMLHKDNRVLGVVIQLKDRWPGHKAGQFAFVTFDPAEGAHPFTISSAWHEDGKLRFLIKGIGDYTSRLPDTLKVGNLVQVEGPYGFFNFTSKKTNQIWVAGGIGITPFIARMQSLAHKPDGRSIDLFYSTSAPDAGFIDKLQKLAKRAQVRLHVLVSGKDGRLSSDRLCEQVPQWQSADLWFCGPAGFGQTLREGLIAKGLAVDDFHQELFEMR